MNNKLVIPTILCAGISISPVTCIGDSFPEAGVDIAPSLGRFIFTFSQTFVFNNPDLKAAFCPGVVLGNCTDAARTIISPIMYEANTKIGRSTPHKDGSYTDTALGTKICQSGTQAVCSTTYPSKRIKDSHFAGVPDDLPGRPGIDFQPGPTPAQDAADETPEEVHTQMISLELKPLWPSYNTQDQYESANRIRAGDKALDQPISIGEVESLSDDGMGFPAESFFNMNVEVDIDLPTQLVEGQPSGGYDGIVDFTFTTHHVTVVDDGTVCDDGTNDCKVTVVGDDPLVIQGYGLQKFPPQLIYRHNATMWAVAMYDKANPTGGEVGQLRVAGHHIDYGTTADGPWGWDETRKGARNGSLRRDEEGWEKKLAQDVATFNEVFESLPLAPIHPQQRVNPVVCQLYALQDHGLNNSQFYGIVPDNLDVKTVSKIYPGLDIEGLATHPINDMLYATSGNNTKYPGYLYSYDVEMGKLTKIGDIGFSDVPSIAFDSKGILWGWVKGKGLITINTQTAKGTMVKEFPGVLVEDITWNNAGTHIYASENTNLWIYEHATQTAKMACSNLPGETEALEMLPDGSLLLGIHGKKKIMKFLGFNVETCEIVFGVDIPTSPTINDVEGIAWPINACSQQP